VKAQIVTYTMGGHGTTTAKVEWEQVTIGDMGVVFPAGTLRKFVPWHRVYEITYDEGSA
jgi:hypothetical protein